jgi:hypothetical protein
LAYVTALIGAISESSLRNQGDLRGNMAFKRAIIQRVGPLSWLLGATSEHTLTDNPYTAPSAEVIDIVDTSKQIKLYSPVQVACGTIGGPVGLIYFLKSNFSALGEYKFERITLIVGILLIPSLVISLVALPENFPSYPFTIAYILSALYVANKYQMTKQAIVDSPQHGFHSNWRVLWIGLLCLVISAILLILPLAALVFFGVTDL